MIISMFDILNKVDDTQRKPKYFYIRLICILNIYIYIYILHFLAPIYVNLIKFWRNI